MDRSIFTMEDEYKVVHVCDLSNNAAFDDLDRVTPNPSFKDTV